MKNAWFEMKYDAKLCFWVVVMGEREYGLCCGECFDLFVNRDTRIICRLELDREWYIIMDGGRRFYLHPKESYLIDV
jgi:hypothetical protein